MSSRFKRRLFLSLLLTGFAIFSIASLIRTHKTENQENGDADSTPSGLTRSGQRDIHLVVGYYQGNNLPWIHQENLTQEVLDLNLFQPEDGYGRNGEAVLIPSFEAPKMNRLFQVNRYNLMASDRILLNRTLPDVRRKECLSLVYTESLPNTSIIIVFHNEAWSTLLRTLHSVINRSPKAFLEEIILVDDASTRAFLKSALDEHIALLSVPVKILRSKERIGLIKARLLGAKEAKGQVLTFLDSHCETTQGWLEPLLFRIHENPKAIVSPIIDIINDETFAFVRSFEMHQGGINWALHFRWFTLPATLIQRRIPNPTKPFMTPVMAGGLFSIRKEFFYELGSYDEQMEIWGGENIELSFRGWMCGAVLEIVPCSHVGHLFRKSSPYTFPRGVSQTLHANLARVALVWMDEWKNFYFKTHPEVGALAGNQSVQSRVDLREKLDCRSFDWYLRTVWPSNFFPAHNRFIGKIRNRKSRKCLETPKAKSLSQPFGEARLQTCILEVFTPQTFVMTPSGSIATDDSVCLDAPQHASLSETPVKIMACNTLQRQRWKYDKKSKHLRHISSGKCLDLPSSQIHKSLTLRKCDIGSASQQWLLEAMDWTSA